MIIYFKMCESILLLKKHFYDERKLCWELINIKDSVTDIEPNELKKFADLYPKSFFTDSYDSLDISIESFNVTSKVKNFYGDVYLILGKDNNNNIIISIFVTTHPSKLFQFNMLITKHISQMLNGDNFKNVSLYIHSYASSLFGCKYVATRPLKHMLKILKKNIKDLITVENEESFFRLSPADLNNFMGIADGDQTYAFEITNDFMNLHKSSPLIFSHIKLN